MTYSLTISFVVTAAPLINSVLTTSFYPTKAPLPLAEARDSRGSVKVLVASSSGSIAY